MSAGRPYLTATLYAPLASFGDIAVGGERRSGRRPTRSALLGLVGAALGIEREDGARQRQLADSYGIAVQMLAVGKPLLDYHTAQVPHGRTGRGGATRREEIGGDKHALNTILSSRGYRMDSFAIFALTERENAVAPLDLVREKMQRPHFVLSAGRKSCSLALPLGPRLGVHANVVDALDDHRRALNQFLSKPAMAGFSRLRLSPGEISMDLDDARQEELDIREVVSVRDQPVSRDRWQFDLRSMAILRAEG